MTDSLLPINATTQERAIEGAAARVSDVPVVVRETWNPDTCPPALLPWLASQFAVDAWDANWSDAQKRQAIKDSISVHRRKGTIGAVKRALASLGFDARVQEWFNQEPVGDPYTFRVLLEADQVGASQNSIQSLVTVVERAKNLRSHLDGVELSVKTQAGPYLAACANVGSEIVVTNYVPGMIVANETTICM